MRLQTDQAKRLSLQIARITSGLVVLCAPMVALAGPAAAQSTFSDHLWKFANSAATNMIDFNKGGSKIFDNGNLTVQTDDQLNLVAPTKVVASHDLAVSHTLFLWRNGINTGGSKIYEDNNLHLATDDRLYLDAPNFVQVSNKLNVLGNTTLGGTLALTGTANVGGDVNVTGDVHSDGIFYGDGSGLTNLNVSVDNLDSLTLNGVQTDFSGNVLVGGAQWSHGSFAVQDPNESVLFNVDNECDGHGYSCVTVAQGGNGGEFDINTDNTYVNGNINVSGDSGLWGDVNLGSSSDNSIFVNGRLYGWDGDPVTVGHYSDTSGFKVWGNTDLRGDLSVGGWGTAGNGAVFSVQTDCSYGGSPSIPAGCITLGGNQDGETNSQANIFVNGRLYGYNTGEGYLPVTIGHHFDASNSGLLVWGESELAGGAQVGMPFDYHDLTVYGNSTLNGDLTVDGGNHLYFNDGQWNQYVNSDTQDLTLYNSNSDTDVFRLSENGDLTITGASRHATLDLANDGDLYVEGNTTLGTSKWDSVTVNGRLYGEEGGPVTVGRDSSRNDFKVWGNTDLRGDLSVGGWGVGNNDPSFQVSNGCGYDGPGGGCISLGSDSYNAMISVNGRLYGAFNGDGFDPVTIGHHGDYNNSGFKVWGYSTLAGGAQVGESWDNNDLTVYGNMYMDASTRHAVLDLQNDGDLNVEGNTTLGSSSWDELDVNAEAYFNSYTEFDNETDFYGNMYLENGTMYVDNGNSIVMNGGGGLTINGNGNLTVTGTTTVNNLVINGTQTFNGAVVYNSSATFNGNATYNGNLTAGTTILNGSLTATSGTFSNTLSATAGVDFSGASSLRVPVTASALVDNSTVCTVGGRITFSTNDNHFYGCDGAHWQILDN